jgi:DNA invertase Pin-like site-specific DNA recombinase
MKIHDDEVLRLWHLNNGVSASKTARHFGVTRQTVYDCLARINRSKPLRYQAGEPEEQVAVSNAVRAFLDSIGVEHD